MIGMTTQHLVGLWFCGLAVGLAGAWAVVAVYLWIMGRACPEKKNGNADLRSAIPGDAAKCEPLPPAMDPPAGVTLVPFGDLREALNARDLARCRRCGGNPR